MIALIAIYSALFLATATAQSYNFTIVNNHVLLNGSSKVHGAIEPLIAQVRTQVGFLSTDSILGTDQTYQRYLHQSRNNVDQAVAKIKETAIWRRVNKIDTILADDVSVLKDSLPYQCTGYTDEGNPVFYIPLGKWNLRKVQRDRQDARLQTYINQMFESALQTSHHHVNPRTMEPVYQTVFIIDLQGLTLRQLFSGWGRSFRTLVRAARTYEQHYPNSVKTWYIVRAPNNFRALWFFMRRFVAPDTASTVEVYSRWSFRWRSVLRSQIPKVALPKSLNL